MPVKKTKSTTVKTKKAPTTKLKSGSFFSWTQWEALFGESLNIWSSIIVRYAGVFLMSLGLQLVGVFALMASTLSIFGGTETLLKTFTGDLSALENLVANALVGNVPPLPQIWSFTGVLGLWILWAGTVGAFSKIGVLALLRDHFKKQHHSAWYLLFADGAHFFWRYVWLSFKIFLVAAWPVILVYLLLMAWSVLVQVNFEAGTEIPYTTERIIPIGLTGVFALTLVYAVYKTITLFFAPPNLVYSQASAAHAWAKSKQLTSGAWWYTFLMWLLFVALLVVINEGLTLAALNDPTEWVINLLAFLVAAFILAPVTVAFQFCLMRQVAKNQSIKL